MIESVTIKNLRGIREGSLEGLSPLVVLVGPNSSGKSTILDALLVGGGRRPGGCVGFVVKRRHGLRHSARWLFFRGAREHQAQIDVKLTGGEGRTRILTWHDEAVHESLRRELVEKGASGAFSSIDVETVSGTGADGIAVFAPDNAYVSKDVELEPPEATPHVRMIDQRLGRSPHELYSRISEKGRRSAVRDLVAAVVPGLEILEVLTDHDDPRLHLSFSDYSVPVALAGDGVQALVRLCLEFATSTNGTALIEEPEAHEHPAAIRQSARAIVEGVRAGTQVVLTTHSLELIDALVNELNEEELELLSLYRLKLVDGALRQSRLDGSEVRRSREVIGDDLR